MSDGANTFRPENVSVPNGLGFGLLEAEVPGPDRVHELHRDQRLGRGARRHFRGVTDDDRKRPHAMADALDLVVAQLDVLGVDALHVERRELRVGARNLAPSPSCVRNHSMHALSGSLDRMMRSAEAHAVVGIEGIAAVARSLM
jgi:hypothetical protein